MKRNLKVCRKCQYFHITNVTWISKDAMEKNLPIEKLRQGIDFGCQYFCGVPVEPGSNIVESGKAWNTEDWDNADIPTQCPCKMEIIVIGQNKPSLMSRFIECIYRR